jgi:hypothetical protein
MKIVFIAFLSLVFASAPTFASPLNRAHVSANPQWVLHIDCDALRPTQFGQSFFAELQQPMWIDKFPVLQVLPNFNPRKQLHGLTFYSNTTYSDDYVMVVYAEFQDRRIASAAKSAKGYQTGTHRGHRIHSWITKEKRETERAYVAVDGSRLIFGSHLEVVMQALDVIEDGASLRKSGLYAWLSSAGTPVRGVSRKLEFEGIAAALLNQAEGGRFELREQNGKVSAALTLDSASEQGAGNLHSLARVVLAAMGFQTSRPELSNLATNAVLKQAGSKVVCDWSLPPADAVGILRAAALGKKARAPRTE